MNYLERSDAKFVAQAADDSQRYAAIEHLCGLRRTIFWVATLLSICFLLICILGAFHPTLGALGGALGIGLFMLAQWMTLMKVESDLRLLKVVEQLRRGSL
jgi:hypothetical protein